MRHLACICFSFIFYFGCSNTLKAQWLEVGFSAGTSNYLGDLVEGHLAPSEYNIAFGAFGRYQMSKYISFKGYANKVELTGSDANNRSDLRQRNLSFRTNLVEIGIVNEISITPYSPREDKNALPYVFVGISGFHFNPQAEFKGTFYDLRPLGTEGQGNVLAGSKTYSAFGFAIPFGFGFKWNVSPLINIGAEFGMRITTTDYLDDVSGRYPNLELLAQQNPLAATLSYRANEINPDLDFSNAQGGIRGNPDNADWYFIAAINFSINLTDAYGLEWDRTYRSFSEDPLPKESKSSKYKINNSQKRKKTTKGKKRTKRKKG